MAAEGGNTSVSDAAGGPTPVQVKIGSGKKKNRSRSASASSVSSVSSGSYTGKACTTWQVITTI